MDNNNEFLKRILRLMESDHVDPQYIRLQVIDALRERLDLAADYVPAGGPDIGPGEVVIRTNLRGGGWEIHKDATGRVTHYVVVTEADLVRAGYVKAATAPPTSGALSACYILPEPSAPYPNCPFCSVGDGVISGTSYATGGGGGVIIGSGTSYGTGGGGGASIGTGFGSGGSGGIIEPAKGLT